MALAAHAAGSGEKEDDCINTKRTAGHSDGDVYCHPGQRPPRSTSAATAAVTGNREHTAFRGMSLSRPSGAGSNPNDANGTGRAKTTPCPSKVAPIDGVCAPGRGVPEADAHQDDEATASSAEEEKKAGKIRAQMSVLMVGFFEIIRQVRATCSGFDGWPDEACSVSLRGKRGLHVGRGGCILERLAWELFVTGMEQLAASRSPC